MNSSKNIIWIDLDEVLADSVKYVIEYHNNKINGKTIFFDNITDYNLENMFDIDTSTAIEWFMKWQINDEKNLNVNPIEWAKKKLVELKNKWYILKIVTARNSERLWNYTSNWIEKYYENLFSDIIFANHYSKNHRAKSAICKDHNIWCMVEDNPYYAQELWENNIQTYLLEKPWNRHLTNLHENIIPVKNWREIRI